MNIRRIKQCYIFQIIKYYAIIKKVNIMPNEILYIIEKINSFGFKAYVVGGSVRDFYLGKKPYDYDIATSAKPEDIKKIFKNNVLSTIGEKYGTIIIKINSFDVEITTFRLEDNYKDNRKPSEVFFTSDLKEDLKRRDFTINAMAYSEKEGLIDLFNGREDLDKKIIRTVGDPFTRINEDALRILRGIRLAGQLDFKIEENLYKEIIKNRHLLRNLSKERIKTELDKILLSDIPSKALRIMAQTSVLEIIMPDLYETVDYDQKTPYHQRTLFDHILCVVDNVPKKLSTRYAALFHDIAKPKTLSIDKFGHGHFYGHDDLGAQMAGKILKEYNSSNYLIESVKPLVKEHMKAPEDEMSDKALRRLIKRVGKDNVLDLLDLMISDRICTTDNREIEYLIQRQNRIYELLNEEICKNDKFLKIDGNDLIKLGFKQGKELGEILSYLEEIVLDDPSLNEKEILQKKVIEKYRS